MMRTLITAAFALLFVAGAEAGDGKDRIDRRDGISSTYRASGGPQEGRASAEGEPEYRQFKPRRQDDR